MAILQLQNFDCLHLEWNFTLFFSSRDDFLVDASSWAFTLLTQQHNHSNFYEQEYNIALPNSRVLNLLKHNPVS